MEECYVNYSCVNGYCPLIVEEEKCGGRTSTCEDCCGGGFHGCNSCYFQGSGMCDECIHKGR